MIDKDEKLMHELDKKRWRLSRRLCIVCKDAKGEVSLTFYGPENICLVCWKENGGKVQQLKDSK